MEKSDRPDIETIRKSLQTVCDICSSHGGCRDCCFNSVEGSDFLGCIFEYPPERWPEIFGEQFAALSNNKEVTIDADDVSITKQGRNVRAYFTCPRCECEFNCDIRKCVDIAAEPHHECPNCGYFVKSDCVK